MPLLLRVCVFCSWSRTCRFLQPAAMESVRAFSDQQILSRNQENLASLSFLTTSKKMIDNWLRRLNRKELNCARRQWGNQKEFFGRLGATSPSEASWERENVSVCEAKRAKRRTRAWIGLENFYKECLAKEILRRLRKE